MASGWLWSDSLDAVIAAPNHHRVVLENAYVRVLDTRIGPGERTPVHTHQWPACHYVVSWSDFIRRDEHGHVSVDSATIDLRFAPGVSFWGDALPPHSLENVGTQLLHIISTEVKPQA